MNKNVFIYCLDCIIVIYWVYTFGLCYIVVVLVYTFGL